jgi:hypothetical protein
MNWAPFRDPDEYPENAMKPTEQAKSSPKEFDFVFSPKDGDGRGFGFRCVDFPKQGIRILGAVLRSWTRTKAPNGFHVFEEILDWYGDRSSREFVEVSGIDLHIVPAKRRLD